MRILEGNPGKRAISDNEPLYTAGIPAMPKRTSAGARKIWDELSVEMMGARVLRKVDKRALWQLCEDEAILEEIYAGLWRRVRQLQHERRQAVELAAASSPVSVPADPLMAMVDHLSGSEGKRVMVALNRLAERVMNERREFGLTPSSRTRINTAFQDVAADNLELNLCG
jgi:phage terminase small subunit